MSSGINFLNTSNFINTMSRSVGPRNLSVGTLWPDKSSAIPTVTDNLYRQGKISQNLVALYFEPTNSTSATNGEVIFGSTDSSKYTGDITYL